MPFRQLLVTVSVKVGAANGVGLVPVQLVETAVDTSSLTAPDGRLFRRGAGIGDFEREIEVLADGLRALRRSRQ